MGQTWRYIPPIDLTGAEQMALDRWLLSQHQQGEPPCLRFYRWHPAAISLGYHQREYPTHWNSLTWAGMPLELVRRPTGGRAVLHQGELTYAVITSGLSPRRRESYEQICQFLIQGWRSLGIALHYGDAGRGYIKNPNCFGTATAADLVLDDGAKFIGSAQLHQDGAILQHGSMRLTQDVGLFAQVFGELGQMPRFDRAFDDATIIHALTEAAKNCFGMDLAIAPLTAAELQCLTL
jgi:lipoate---protein ligase